MTDTQASRGAVQLLYLPSSVESRVSRSAAQVLIQPLPPGYYVRTVGSPRVLQMKWSDGVWRPVKYAVTSIPTSGLTLWFDAADYAPGTWGNKVVGGPSLTFYGSPQPTVSGTTLNGKSVVRFTAGQGKVGIPSGTGIDKEWTLAHVVRIVSSPARVVGGIFPTRNFAIGYHGGNMNAYHDNGGWGSPDVRTPATTAWKLYSGDGTGSNTRMFSNGALLSSFSSAAGWGGTFTISGYSTGTDETSTCEIAEVMLYNRKLTDTERGDVENYLKGKWGL